MFCVEYYPPVFSVLCGICREIHKVSADSTEESTGRKEELLFCRKLPLGKFGSYLWPVLDYKWCAHNSDAMPSVWISLNWTASILTYRSFFTEIVLDLTVIISIFPVEVFPHLNPIIGPIFELHIGFGVLELPAVHKLSCQSKRAPYTLSLEHCIVSGIGFFWA